MTETPDLCPDEQLADATALVDVNGRDGEAAIERLCRRYPHDPRLHFLLGSLAAGERRYDQAKRSMTHALAIEPGYALARFQLGLLLLTSGEAGPASDVLQPLIELAPDAPLRLFATGLLHLMCDEFARAIDAIERGIEYNHANPPLNHDMRMLVAEIAARAKPAEVTEPEPHSAAHALLQQSALKATKH